MFIDFIEIGTADFETLVESAEPRQRGICVEPLIEYLSALKQLPFVVQEQCAISDFDGTTEIYYVSSKDIDAHGLPFFLKGCNSIGAAHPTTARILQQAGLEHLMKRESVPVYRLITLLQKHNVSTLFKLKIDTEGHDAVILEDFLDNAIPSMYPFQLWFETNVLSNTRQVQNLIAKLIYKGYDLIESSTLGGASNTVMYRNIQASRKGIGIVSSSLGYYITNYPDGYNPEKLPHKNNLDDALAYCKATKSAGVTLQYGRYEVRKGPYLQYDSTLGPQSWILV